jgi:hypothetical protein
MTKRLDQLAALGLMLRDIELAKLRQLQDIRRDIEKTQAKLRTTRLAVLASICPGPAAATGTPEKWLDWAKVRRHDLVIRNARAAAEAEAQFLKAGKAFGRAQVLAQLAQSAQADRTRR